MAIKDDVKVEGVLLRDSDLGNVGDVVMVAASDVAAYALGGMVDTHKEAVAYAKSKK